MRTVWLIIGIHVTVLGCAFVFAGFTTLVTPSEAELETTRQACEGERQKGWWHGFIYSLSEVGSYRFRGLSLAISGTGLKGRPIADLFTSVSPV